MPHTTLDILLSQRFLPEHGGSIHWMHEVYRRWPGNVDVITHNYYDFPPHTPEFPGTPVRPAGGDDVTDPNLKLDRRDIFLRDWGLDRPGKIVRYLRMTRAVRRRLARHKGIVRVHCTHAVPEVASLIPLRKLYGRRLKVICYAHGEEITACQSSRQLRFLMRRAHRIVDLMIANSASTRALLAAHIDVNKVQIVHPGVDLTEYADAAAAGARWREQRGLTGKRVVATLGRLDPRKNHAAVIEAVAALATKMPDLVYVIASAGRQMEKLKALAQQRGIAGRVQFAGPVSAGEKLGLLGGCDVFAMPAIRDGTDVEGFGMVFLEAGACNKPCLAGREGGQAEAVGDGDSGLIVNGTDQPAVTAALERLLSDPPLRARMGAAGRRRAEAHDWPQVVQRINQLVETYV